MATGNGEVNMDDLFTLGQKSEGTGKTAQSQSWYAANFDELKVLATGQIPQTEVVGRITLIRSKDSRKGKVNPVQLGLEKWGTDGNYKKHSGYAPVAPWAYLMFTALKTLGAIPADTEFLMTSDAAKSKVAARRSPAGGVVTVIGAGQSRRPAQRAVTVLQTGPQE